jgi:formylglycine-generating enzyme required for sulfatase activity
MAFVRNRKSIFMLALCLVWPMANAASELVKLHPHPMKTPEKNCQSCHEQEKAMLSLSKAQTEKCKSCHQLTQGNDTGEADLIKTAAAPPKILQLNQEKMPVGKKLAPNAGMQYPMYYEQSRLGDAPGEMVLIPAGEFIMGSDSRLPDEGPQHIVNLKSYYVDVNEVTNLQYRKFNNETKRRSPTHFRNRTFPRGKADHPVTYVTWEDANDYCQWAGKRLPTDQEWEKAARGTDGRIFPWGNEFDASKANTPLRWQQIGSFGDTTPVGSFKAGVSPYGIYDMSGNVWEWTASWYKAYPGNKVVSESYGERYKTLKGGSWFDCSFYNCGISAPVFNRAFFSIRTKNDSFGFRCAKDAP